MHRCISECMLSCVYGPMRTCNKGGSIKKDTPSGGPTNGPLKNNMKLLVTCWVSVCPCLPNRRIILNSHVYFAAGIDQCMILNLSVYLFIPRGSGNSSKLEDLWVWTDCP